MDTLTDWFGIPLPIPVLEFVRSNVQDGGSNNGPYRGGKGSVYEGGVLVPSFVYMPGMLKTRHLNTRVTVQDVLPTLAEAAGIELPQDTVLDGSSQWLAITNAGSVTVRDYAISGMNGEAYYQGDYKLVVAASDGPGLYNLHDDPLEGKDLASAEPDRVQAMQTKLQALPRGENIHQDSTLNFILDPDRFGGGEEDRPPWIEQVRD